MADNSYIFNILSVLVSPELKEESNITRLSVNDKTAPLIHDEYTKTNVNFTHSCKRQRGQEEKRANVGDHVVLVAGNAGWTSTLQRGETL